MITKIQCSQNDSLAYLDDVNYYTMQSSSEDLPKKNIHINDAKMLLWLDGMYTEFHFELNKRPFIPPRPSSRTLHR